MATGRKDAKLLIDFGLSRAYSKFCSQDANTTADEIVVSWGDDNLRITLVDNDHPAVEI
ncbi:MAG: hypothetical protein VX733_12510 [Candidatus Latescibacterota bacterium]|nr:hypothetical protein [Candidatus Latescibacterota bacterium]